MLGTDEIVKQAMEEEKQRKQAKAQAKGDGRQRMQLLMRMMSHSHHPAPRKHKGKTLAEIEEEEGGPVKQSMAPMAHVKRAKKRKDRNDIGMTLGGWFVTIQYCTIRKSIDVVLVSLMCDSLGVTALRVTHQHDCICRLNR